MTFGVLSLIVNTRRRVLGVARSSPRGASASELMRTPMPSCPDERVSRTCTQAVKGRKSRWWNLPWIELRHGLTLLALMLPVALKGRSDTLDGVALLVARRRRDDLYEVRAQPCRGLRLGVERWREGRRVHEPFVDAFHGSRSSDAPPRFQDLARSAARERGYRRCYGAADRVAGPLARRRGVGHRATLAAYVLGADTSSFATSGMETSLLVSWSFCACAGCSRSHVLEAHGLPRTLS